MTHRDRFYQLGAGGMTDDMFNPDTLKDVAIAGGVGLVTAIVGGRAINYVEGMLPATLEASTKEYVASGLTVAAGLLLAAYVHQFSRPAAFAIGGVMLGEGAARLVRKAAALDTAWALPSGSGEAAASTSTGVAALRGAQIELMRQLRGAGNSPRALAATVVTPGTRANGLTGASDRYAAYY